MAEGVRSIVGKFGIVGIVGGSLVVVVVVVAALGAPVDVDEPARLRGAAAAQRPRAAAAGVVLARVDATSQPSQPRTEATIQHNDGAYRAFKRGFSKRVRECIAESRLCKRAAWGWNDTLTALRGPGGG